MEQNLLPDFYHTMEVDRNWEALSLSFSIYIKWCKSPSMNSGLNSTQSFFRTPK